jgi:hypothetical protein
MSPVSLLNPLVFLVSRKIIQPATSPLNPDIKTPLNPGDDGR